MEEEFTKGGMERGFRRGCKGRLFSYTATLTFYPLPSRERKRGKE